MLIQQIIHIFSHDTITDTNISQKIQYIFEAQVTQKRN